MNKMRQLIDRMELIDSSLKQCTLIGVSLSCDEINMYPEYRQHGLVH